MAREDLKKQAVKTWNELGEAIKRVFGLTGTIEQETIASALRSNDEELMKFINYWNDFKMRLEEIEKRNKR
ncbi:MAG: hypothetical protein ABH891_07075 [Candidatus Omnitrophota bacterium]